MKYTILFSYTLGLVAASPYKIPDLNDFKYSPQTLAACEEADDCKVLDTPDGLVMIGSHESDPQALHSLKRTSPPKNTKPIIPECTSHEPKTFLKPHANPDPHQNFVIVQPKGGHESCGGEGAGVGEIEGTTVGWSFSLTGAATPEGLGASFGFSLEESKSWSTSHSCNCNAQQDAICVLFYTAMTAFTAELWYDKGNDCDDGPRQRFDSLVVVFAPNAEDKGSANGCGTDFGPSDGPNSVHQCVQDYRKLTVRCGPKGGPEFWGEETGMGPWQTKFQNHMEGPDCDNKYLMTMLNKYNGTQIVHY
ncbi:hypothetical protein K461DRAFT_301134 [Myriangium duriaei CBS 260.36]|uniref:Uncharacterized protein n=1 Tax=Myriangium duriaei CBS 260.36 TaxID=1168546 RepID=A0A9P4IW73_9PEZI|nr:hypothetical protein K461DRAFT_301134 [Myriangium duriaei CBS 260.36]